MCWSAMYYNIVMVNCLVKSSICKSNQWMLVKLDHNELAPTSASVGYFIDCIGWGFSSSF
jgi:hypothetical protein